MKIDLRKGLDIRLAGEIKDSGVADVEPSECAVFPSDYPGLKPKLDVREGDTVEVGTPLLHDKTYPQISLVSPVSGTVKAIIRGERRKVLAVIVSNDRQGRRRAVDTSLPLIDLLCTSGLFAMMRRRPFDALPRPDSVPRDIFITAFDSAPLAPAMLSALRPDASRCMGAAVDALSALTPGRVFISVRPGTELPPLPSATVVEVAGPHPAGNVGIQIANIAPVNKGEEVWTLDAVTLCRIGRLLLDGLLDVSATVALVGPEVERPAMLRTVIGASINDLIDGRLNNDGVAKRVISGNVLSGTAVTGSSDAFLHFPWRQVTVIADGADCDEFMGWASLSPRKLSVSRTFPFSRLTRRFSPDARINGSPRAMIMSGEYDRVLPADILPEFLIKAIISRNLEDMEGLGIYEVAPEDFALCEFVDTSKLPLQQIVRDGLDFMMAEAD